MQDLPKAGQAQWNEKILTQAIQMWGAQEATLSPLSDPSHFLYLVETPAQKWVLRFSHQSQTSPTWLQAENAWLQALRQEQLEVPLPQPSSAGHGFEKIEEFFVSAFVWAEGEQHPFYQEEAWGIQQLFELGRLLARLHNQADGFRPPEAEKRPEWFENHPILERSDWAPPEQNLCATFENLHQECLNWSQEPAVWGLIHANIGPMNLAIRENGSFTLLNFDQSAYHWYSGDLAALLFHYLLVKSARNRRIFSTKFLQCLLAGYRQERPFDLLWEKRIPLLLKLHSLWFYLSNAARLQANYGPLTEEVRQAMQAHFLVYQGLTD
ncbi:hypothetical protein COW36_21480 [bacterium (Candidatus Blackallbacteria) CG17_big_fil_post_rev_8_21_14_2_50_48_46]|uniref:Aminoglycoside phosphotransferase domain-containing protein n=1 Tax=bacterium (Candidatus Blackallbacteria) CG17_big_fil_post_rev_8_21_14_2_50_48_46 TaxID=2014261 RepID=A0A2M7FZ22_9BACT|nr:MAG: hypothetical protein COW64_14780 [bacterium (Candidatus Blackallbacteria) CG18_big_fil_WC_8_21_14_2_50_49_26]PIW14611.1 MAG: hypothetical protein COW36_21480 [bacterium (Candidatus Blackallbacteria) CG17_big_fil_post_rev_8_21_14_2_50_48_46]PIW45662.1 MAG: hypothetical protein COW20_19310 [bacterium (Candidatus Blackallbacteria) CG13_big_fil_rev_8_21_14_2_50_49_14]